MALFGISEKRAFAIARSEAKIADRLRRLERLPADRALEDRISELQNRCPLCGEPVQVRERHERRDSDRITITEDVTFACGSQRIHKDGKTRFVAKCLEVR